MKRLLLAVLAVGLVVLVFANAQASDRVCFKSYCLEDDELKKLKAKKNFTDENLECRIVEQKAIADSYCRVISEKDKTIAGVKAKNVGLFYVNWKLYEIMIQFDPKDFYPVSTALEDKYGPGQAELHEVQNQVGAKFENERITWRTNGATITLEKYWSRLDQAAVTYTSDSLMMEIECRREEDRKKRASDL